MLKYIPWFFVEKGDSDVVIVPNLWNAMDTYFAEHQIDKKLETKTSEIVTEYLDALIPWQGRDLTTLRIALLLFRGKKAAIWLLNEGLDEDTEIPEDEVNRIGMSLVRTIFLFEYAAQQEILDYLFLPANTDIVLEEN